MKQMIKAFVIAAAVVSCAPSHANDDDINSKRCMAIANFSYEVADARDTGFPYNRTLATVRSTVTAYVPRKLMEDVVFRAYHSQLRYLSRSELAAFGYGNCMDYLRNVRYQDSYQ